MPRGRPAGSKIRQNIVEILHYAKQAHGYNIYAIYKEIFPKVTMRAIYYNLKKGVDTRELKVAQIKKEKGNYSWGGEVERIYYSLGETAKPAGLPVVKEYFDKKSS
ncbi:hypothetical protein CMO88_01345 [Candidatus Woesearchaeota archaeon]|nr:hypothetical protein [Candidatus Woesearchaeota archaeon]|tara:strand:- start:17999 stop:18316 length:318 start_codon:yes stop_codon:yes gene_type:complete